MHTHAGGAGAPDLGGLLFRARVYMAVPGRRPAAGRGGGGEGELTLSFFKLTLDFFNVRDTNLPYTYPIFFWYAG